MKSIPLLFIAAALFILSGCGSSAGQNNAVTAFVATDGWLCSEHTYTTDGTGTMLIGDSNTHALPADILPGNYVNCGVNGFDSKLALEQLVQKFPQYNPGTVVIWIGTNDARAGAADSYFSQNMTGILDYLNTKNAQVYVRDILPTGSPYEGINDKTLKLNTVEQNLASSGTFTYLHSRRLFEDAAGYLDAGLTYDGIHLNASGQDILRQNFFNL